MSDSPVRGTGESKEPETPAAVGQDILPESSPWQRAKDLAESMNLQAVMEDMERRYYELRQDRDSLQEKVKAITVEKESAAKAVSSLSIIQQEKETLQNKLSQQEIKSKGLEEEKTLLQERMDRLTTEADQLREELGYVNKNPLSGARSWTIGLSYSLYVRACSQTDSKISF